MESSSFSGGGDVSPAYGVPKFESMLTRVRRAKEQANERYKYLALLESKLINDPELEMLVDVTRNLY